MTEAIPVSSVIAAGAWSDAADDLIRLDYEGRHRRRIVLHGASGASYLLNLAEVTHLRDGDGLRLADGRTVRIVAEPEPLLEIRAQGPVALTRVAWHLGNRHLAAAIGRDVILIRRDPVIARMLERLGAQLRDVEAPFDPEGGAYHDHDH